MAIVNKIRINIGCGRTPTEGWHNYDNSLSLRLARFPFLDRIVFALPFIPQFHKDFMSFIKTSDIKWADATKRIPESDGTVDVLYSSHMLEHINRDKVNDFLYEAKRVLRSGGIIRIAVPDIRLLIEDYLKNEDADDFMSKTELVTGRPTTLFKRLQYVIVGERYHQWMYDGKSLCRLLSEMGFQNPEIMQPGETKIADPAPLNLEERKIDSVYVEAINP